MKDGSYRFDVGDFACVALSDGSHDYAPGAFFANVPQAEAEKALRAHNMPTDHITTPYTYLYVDTGSDQVLVDMGAGDMTPETGKLLGNMAAVGIDPVQIDVVVITHAHPDHVGGTLDGDGKLVFANARYYIWKRDWDFWFSDEAPEMAPPAHVDIARRNLEPLQDRIQFLEDESEFYPGIRAIQAPGHTPGHLAILVSSGDENVFYISDTVLSPLHLEHPDWLPVFDILPDEAETSKRRVFDMAADEDLLVLGMHFPPFPSLGHIVKKAAGWQWRPIEP